MNHNPLYYNPFPRKMQGVSMKKMDFVRNADGWGSTRLRFNNFKHILNSLTNA